MKDIMVTWFEISVEDMARAQKFYETVLQTKLNDTPTPEKMGMTMMSFPWTDNMSGAGGALVKSDMAKPSSTGTLVYFGSEDCSELDRVEQSGGKLLMAKTPVEGFGFFGFFTDTEGNNIGLFSQN